ncbi:glycerate kinase type-2 family protein [Stieleria varia]|uniref:Putative hydroxypyruvate reductase n=1 Tax=Stieleria varia TaxID=2528005 RepID=A0A5C6B679_9BACT|nr:DUF4147 domain-containing protein [Stieleria varia]TWU07795.1 putative hydroxypyruvate reductase [Stieleria varia]
MDATQPDQYPSSDVHPAIRIWNTGVLAVNPRTQVMNACQIDPSSINIAGHEFSREQIKRVIVVGGGKATAAMTQGFVDAVQGQIPTCGWVNVPQDKPERSIGKTDSAEYLSGIRVFPARPMGLNEPTAAAVQGTLEIIRLTQQADASDLCVALISGGGSALLTLPADGITLQDKLQVIRRLSESGADIVQLNTVRKHLSEVKGGGLLAACNGPLVTLVLSDVLGDPLDLIASGPTVPDTSLPSDAMNILQHFDPQRSLPANVYRVLERAVASTNDETQNRLQDFTPPVVIGNNETAVNASAELARELMFETESKSAQTCEGCAETIGIQIAQWILTRLDQSVATCLVWGGEPTVSLAPPDLRGLGGRNQQLVLAAYQRLLQANLSDEEWSRISLVSGGTDGEDGPTDAAGAVLTGSVHQKAQQLDLDVESSLSRNDAYHFFQQCGGLLKSGPTGTNVCDVRVAIVTGRQHPAGNAP